MNDNMQPQNLKNYSTMKIGGEAKYVRDITSLESLNEAVQFTQENNLKIFPIGSGSNTIFTDNNKSGLNKYLFLVIKISGITKTYDGPEFANIEAGAGENWDEFVAWTIEHGLSGLESLSGIPGTVGAGPIQNIGAYGSEISKHLASVTVFDIASQKAYEISNNDCSFAYRDSIFKQNIGKFVILSVSFSLPKKVTNLEVPEYKDLQLYFLEKKQKTATALQIREAVIEIRNNKIPSPNKTPNTGSFFKNPIVPNELAGKISRENPEMPYSKLNDNESKLYAGWLIEKCELKGFNFGKIKIDDKNALILTNPGGLGTFNDLEKAIAQIQAQVYEKFEVELEVEPNIVT